MLVPGRLILVQSQPSARQFPGVATFSLAYGHRPRICHPGTHPLTNLCCFQWSPLL